MLVSPGALLAGTRRKRGAYVPPTEAPANPAPPAITSVTIDNTSPQVGNVLTATAVVDPGSPAATYTWTWTVSDPP